MKNKFIKIASDLVSHVHDTGVLSFVFKTKVHFIIICYIYGHDKITFENLCKVTQSTVSRTTIQNILSEGVKLGHLKKFVDKEDKRKSIFHVNNLNQFWKNGTINNRKYLIS